MSSHHKTHSIALKEWAAVCDALAKGSQRILFRKGGIHEGPEGFQPEHREFWLFPTGFHQTLEGVRAEFHSDAQEIKAHSPFAGIIPIQCYCVVESVIWVENEQALASLQPFHVMTEEAIAKRFHYRQPGLYVLVVTSRKLAEPVLLAADPRYDGCHSWVTLNDAISTDSLSPVGANQTSVAEVIQHLLISNG